MYEIKFIHKNETTENTLYTPGSNTYCLLSARLNLECGKAGELTLEVPDANPAKADFVCLTDEILVYRDGEELWRGRAITREEDFYKTGTLTCEGVLAYLYDTYYPPFEFSGSPTDLLSTVLDNHNAQVEERKRIYLGNVTVEDNNDYIARSSIEYNRTLTVLTDKLINDSLGGYFRVRIEGGVKYLDYLDIYGTTATQPVAFGENLLDIAQEVEYSDLATVILPLGAKLEDSDGNETDEYLTIADVNGGSIYYADEAAVEEYGWIVVCNIWEDVTEASNLLTKAKNYLAQVTSAVSSFEVNAVDLALISSGYAPINLGDMVLIRSEPHGVNQYVELTALDIDLLDPSNDTLTFGADTATLTDSQRSSSRSVQAALDSLSVRYTNLVATTITTEYLSANYATITDLNVISETVKNLTADSITTEYLSANYATIENLDAATANITDLTAEVASINSLLSGNIGAGTVQAIHLSADNTVIDEALIETIYAANGIISDLVTGTIYTDNVQIANNAGQNLWIDGATIQINDGTYVRVQIGEDASGAYNLYIWNANGVLIWDALGLTEAGLTGNGAIIKDAAVADDAAIKGTKLDISSVASCLNEDGSLVVDAANVTINDSTLAAEYVTIKTATTEAQATADEAREKTTTLETKLEVVQGQISSKVWQTDIDTAVDTLAGEITTIQDQYTTVIETIDGITATVGDLTTTVNNNYSTLTSKISTLETTATSITATVRESTAIIGENIIADGTLEGYTTFGTAYSWYTPTPSYITVGTYDDMPCICFTRGGSAYYIRQRVNLPAGTYIFKVKLACGADVAPVCRIRLSSGDVSTYLCEDGELTDEWATYSTTITTEGTSNYFYLYCYSATDVTAPTDTEMYVTDIVLYSSTELDAVMAQIEVLSDSISLSVSNGTLGSTASIKLSVDGEEASSIEVDMTEVRQAFANDTSAVTISAGTVTFEAGTLLINAGNFTMDKDGNIVATNGTFTGKVTATSGTIGGFTIGSSALYNSKSSLSSTASGVYVGTDGISLGSTFSVTKAGVITATSGTIGGWNIYSIKICGGDADTGVAVIQMPTESTDYVFAAGGTSHSSYSDCPFRVTKAGKLYATNAVFQNSVYMYDEFDESTYQVFYACSGLNFTVDATFEKNAEVQGTLYGYNIIAYNHFADYADYNVGAGMTCYWADQLNSGSTHYLIYRDTDGLSAYFGYAGSSTYSTTSVLRGRTVKYQNSSGTTTLSDERIKTDWTSLDNWDGFFDRLEPKAFRYIDGNAGRFHIGMGAQTTEQALLDSGLTTNDFAGLVISPTRPDEEGNGYHGYDEEYGLIYTEFVGLLIDQVQKLKARVTELEAKYG